MKSLKKITVLGLIFILLTTLLTGCGEARQAESTVRKMFSAFQKLDFEGAQSYIDVDELASAEDDDPEQNKMFMKVLFDKLEYKIISSEKIDDNTVMVKAAITNLDMKPVMGEYFKAALEYAFSHLFADPQPTEEEQNAEMEKIFAECVENAETEKVTNEVDIKVVKTEDGWKVESDTKLANAMLGGLLDAAVALSDAFSAE